MSRMLPKSAAIAMLLISALALTACGESAQEKAEAQVCGARSDISKQIAALSGLTFSTSLITEAKAHIEAIAKDLTTIKNAQTNLAPARKEQVEAATHTFETQVTSVVHGLGSTLSITNAEAQLKSAASQLAASYKNSLAPISCS